MLGHEGTPLPFAYVGLGPGQELIPYFWALVALAVTALGAILQWPIMAMRRAIKGTKPATPAVPETPRDGLPDNS